MPTKPKRGYMCMIAFEHELGSCHHGTLVYPSMADLEAHHGCVSECGAVEVEVEIKLVRVVNEQDFSEVKSVRVKGCDDER
jgi:hypothetical protein